MSIGLLYLSRSHIISQTPTGVAVDSICGPVKHTPPQDVPSSLTDHTPSLLQKTTTTSHTSSPSTTHTHPSHTSHQITSVPSSLHTKAHPPTRSTAHTYVNASSTATHVHLASARKRKAVETPESKEMAKKRLELQKKTGELLQKQIDQQKVRGECLYMYIHVVHTECNCDFF